MRLAALLIGLTFATAPTPRECRRYDYALDASLTPAEIAEVERDVAMWQTAIPTPRLTLRRVAACSDTPMATDGHPCATIAGITSEDMLATMGSDNYLGVTRRPGEDAPIQVVVDFSRGTGLGVVAHELGHVMGVPHDAHRGTLMYPSQDLGAHVVTASDVAAWGRVAR